MLRIMSNFSLEKDYSIIKNSPEDIAFRRNSNTLSILGTGVIIFGLWSIIKVLAYVALGVPLYSAADIESFDEVSLDLVMTVLEVMLAGDVIVRLIIGLYAGKEGRKQRKRVPGFYLVFTVWEILFVLFSVIAVIQQFLDARNEEFIEDYVSLFMELSSLVILIEVFIAALSVRRYKKRALDLIRRQK